MVIVSDFLELNVYVGVTVMVTPVGNVVILVVGVMIVLGERERV